jgi:hypothetical protein
MVTQDRFVVIAPVAEERVGALRERLAEMTLPGLPGAANPSDPTLPFGRYDPIHFARFVVLEDHSLADRVAYPRLPKTEPTYLLFMVDCDGDARDMLTRLARECPRLSEIFDHCLEPPGTDLAAWLLARKVTPVASFVNWVGRTVVQIREEAALRAALRESLPKTTEREPRALHAELRRLTTGATTLTPVPPPPASARLVKFAILAAAIIIVIALLLVLPLLALSFALIVLILFTVVLRHHELMDPIQEDRYDLAWVTRLRLGEDHDVTNQYTALGSIRPGWLRLAIARVVLGGINLAARIIFTRGALARVGTIHFAHWIFLDQRRRMVFCSNYDGAHEAYMDDFINKVGFGLNLAFSGAIAYPQTDWLIARGAWREQQFKRFQRSHQIPTDVWYRACPGLTARDMSRNSLVRNGYERDDMSDDEIRRWLAEI